MRKTISAKWLEDRRACVEAIVAFESQSECNPVELIRTMIKTKTHLDWASWLIARIMNKRQCVQYAVFAVDQVIDIFETHHPNDKRPRQAIDAANAYLRRPCKTTKQRAADAAAYAAYAAAAGVAADDADPQVQIKILKYGLTLLETKS